MRDLTKKEEKAIAELKDLALRWPKSLWLFSANGSLCVMKYNEEGERAMKGYSMDGDYLVDRIEGIDNDGGDW